MPTLDAHAVADLLIEIGKRLELSGESPFKFRAYTIGAESLRQLKVPLEELVAKRTLKNLPGVGEAIAEKIIALHKRGSHRTLDHLRETVPDGLLLILRVPGLGPKKVIKLREDLGIEDLDALQSAAESGQLASTKGIGPKLQEKILNSIDFIRESATRFNMPMADELVKKALQEATLWSGTIEAYIVGETRRRCETVSSPALLVCTSAPKTIPQLSGPDETVSILTTAPDSLGLALLFGTGSEAHLQDLIEYAKTKGFDLSPNSLTQNGESIPTPNEKAIYAALKLPFISPELREGRNELKLAIEGKLPKLIKKTDIRGIVHAHTTASDGANSLREMADATRQLGMEYFGVADHSQTAVYAGGLTEQDVVTQHEEIDRLNSEINQDSTTPFKILKGIESDILADGSLDYPDAFLERFDFIVASVHSRFELSEKAQTKRVLAAITHPATTILAHPTGRLLLRRQGFAINLNEIIAACAEYKVTIEINAHPARLDLDWRWHQQAIEAGVKLSINPDAHNTSGLAHFHYGVAIARKGGVSAEHVLNTLSLDEMTTYLQGS